MKTANQLEKTLKEMAERRAFVRLMKALGMSTEQIMGMLRHAQ